jgi:hypothetical protein
VKRKRLLILAGVALAAAVLVPAALELHAYRQKLARGRSVDMAHFKRLLNGMSRAEVETILGGPPGDFTTTGIRFDELRFDDISLHTGDRDEGDHWERWASDHGQIQVCFDRQDDCCCCRCFNGGEEPPQWSFFLWLRRHWP